MFFDNFILIHGPAATMCPKDDPNSIGKGLTKITDDQGRIVQYYLDEVGKIAEAFTNQTFSGGNPTQYMYTKYSYDQYHGTLTEVSNQWKRYMYGFWQTTTLSDNQYTYDEANMRLTNQISNSGGVVRTESYGYDEIYRLTSVNYGDSHTQSYTFDPMGNRLSKVNDGTTENYSYNNANMLLIRGSNNYTNDLAGNTLTGGGRTNTWDSQNRLAQCVNGSNTCNYTYASDGIRHRSAITNGGTTTTTDFVLDNSMFVREMQGSTVKATYLMGARGPEYRRDDSTGAVRWYCYDGLGSVLGEVDSNGTLQASRTYDVYGTVRTSAGTSTSKHKFVGSLGHPSEDETGLVYMQARYMDPTVGRFTSQDPGTHGLNWFLYCGDDPVNRGDPDGRSWKQLFQIIMAVYVLLVMFGVTPEMFLAGIMAAIAMFQAGWAALTAALSNAVSCLSIGSIQGDGFLANLSATLADAFMAVGSMSYAAGMIGGIVALHTLAIIGLISTIDELT